jgi:uncharacterized protein YoaH (UPF0181 family)
MALSKKNYEKLAHYLGQARSKGEAINLIADYLKADNPRFNRTKFVQRISEVHLTYNAGSQKMKTAKIGVKRFRY